MSTSEFHCSVGYDREVPCVVMEWRGYANSSIFREANERVLSAIKERGVTKLLGDVAEFVLIGADDQAWLNEDWIPRAIGAGLRSCALVQPTYYFNRVAIENVASQIDPVKLKVGYFPERMSARLWLMETG